MYVKVSPLLKLPIVYSSSDSSNSLEEEVSKRGGELNLSSMGKMLVRRHADLMVSDEKWKDGLNTPTK